MRVYTSKSGVNCGPCSFINLVGIKGSKKLELTLSNMGRLKPFHASTYSAFLVWADKHNKDILAFTSSRKLNKKMFELMIDYEKIPRSKQREFKDKANSLLKLRNKRFKNKINILKNPFLKLDELLEKKYLVAFLTSDFYLSRLRKPVPHWIVVYKRKGRFYSCMDSAQTDGITILTRAQLEKGIKLNKSQGFMPQLVAYKR
ncbi:Uncharacterised protein [uncultured archaeon]|nr:Uncharacterised protein [uncultured archaeon]